MKKVPLYSAMLLVLTVGCGRETVLKELTASSGPLSVTARISPDKADPATIVGKLKVRNDGNEYARYGNTLLTLSCGGATSHTVVRTSVGSPAVNSSLVSVAPGDSLQFFVQWVFTRKIDFKSGEFSLRFDATPTDSAL